MISVNVFKTQGDASSHVAAYNWPDQPLPAGKIIGRAGNALLMELSVGSVAVISAPLSELQFKQFYRFRFGLPEVNLDWAFA
jgi:hypothetical protein